MMTIKLVLLESLVLTLIDSYSHYNHDILFS
jgi:hypothetical protein